MSINEMLFYGGLIFAVIVVVVFLIFLLIYKINKIKLDYKYDEEYGKKNKY